MQLFPPLRFRFADADHPTFGDRWWVWDIQELAGLRGRDLIDLEEAVDMPLAVIVDGLRVEKTLPTMAAMWIAVHRAGHPVAWNEFNPVVHGAHWEAVPLDPSPGPGEDPTPDSPSSPPPTVESVTS